MAAPDLTNATEITLSGADDVTITDGGVYVLTGTLTDGRVLVNAPGADVTLVLQNADITCTDSSALYIYKAANVLVYLPDGTASTLTDGSSYDDSDSFSSTADEEPNVLPYAQVRSWFFPPEADGEYAVGHGPGPVYALEQLSIPAGVAEKGHAYYMENRVIYLSVDVTAGRAIVSGSVPYEITFTYADGSVSALTCGCYETGLCKHGAALLLQLRETLEKIHEHWPDALAEDGYFAAVSKSAFSFFTTSSSKPASITLT